MNVEVPGMHASGLGWWFGIVGVVFTIAVVAVTAAKKLRYI
jgi:magnesium transporter